MAGRVARRIVLGLVGLVFASAAYAVWGNAHFCQLSEDRFVIFSNGKRFVLTHAAAWELVDANQQAELDKWLTQSNLSKDLGLLVASAPQNHAYTLAGDVNVSNSSDSTTNLQFNIGSGPPKTVTLTSGEEGAQTDMEGTRQFADVASSLGKPASTLLVILADSTNQISDTKAWGLVLKRLQAKPEFFAFIDKQHGLLWIKRDKPIAASSTHSTSPSTSGEPKKSKPEKPSSTDQNDLLAPIGIGASGVLLGLAGGILIARARSLAGPRKSAPALDSFKLSPRERELIDVVRKEITRLGMSSSQVANPEDTVVRDMLDRYRRFEAVSGQVEQLQSYRRFADDHDAFQKQIDIAVSESKANQTRVSDLSRQLQELKSKLEAATAELRALRSERDNIQASQAEAEKLIDDLSAWIAFIGDRLDKFTEQMQDE